MASKDTLTRQDWIHAAFRLLAQSGPKTVRVDYLCRELGVTKGSFYWHFTDLAALRAAMAAQWQRDATGDVVAAMTSPDLSPRELFIRLFEQRARAASHATQAARNEAADAAIGRAADGGQAGVRDADTDRCVPDPAAGRAPPERPEARSRCPSSPRA